jgi:rhamnulokinase
MSWHAAIDLGAGSGRALVGRVGADDVHVEEVHRFRYAPRHADGHLRWDIGRLFAGVRDGVLAAGSRAAAEGAPLASAAVDAWGVDYGLIDADGRLTEEPICYRDDRTDGVMEQVFASMPREEIYRRTGIQFHKLNTLYQLAAHVREGVPRDAARLLLIPDLCHHLLCGSQVSERSDASTTQLLNVHTGSWDDELFSRLGLPRHLMPAVVATGSDLGPLDRALSSHAGLRGTRVVACPTHDTASAVAATPLEPGWAYISSGTWSLVGVERTAPMLTREALDANFTNEAGAFGSIRFLKNVMGLWLLESCRREWEAAGRGVALADLLSGAGSVSGFPGLVVPDDPRFFNPASMVRELRDALAATGQAPHDDPVLLTRVILDSLALRYASVVEDIERVTGAPVEGIHVVGGGSLNDCLSQATADATGRPVVAGPAEATAIGNILVQAIATDTLASLARGRDLVRRTLRPRRFEPQARRDWDSAARQYRKIEAARYAAIDTGN